MSANLWYALKVKPRLEWIVSTGLASKGYEQFLPTYRCRRRWSDRVKTLDLPLFPGYVFCRFDVTRRLPILQTTGVSSIVSIAKCPEPISDAEIEAIRSVVHSHVTYEPHPYLTVGQLVQVQRGALAGLVGLVTQVRNQFRLIVSVNLLMRSVSVEIDRAWVDPIRQPLRYRTAVAAGIPRTSGIAQPSPHFAKTA